MMCGNVQPGPRGRRIVNEKNGRLEVTSGSDHQVTHMTGTTHPPICEKLRPIIDKLLPGLETGQNCEEYAFANGNTFQAMTMAPEGFEALRAVPEASETIIALVRALEQWKCDACGGSGKYLNKRLHYPADMGRPVMLKEIMPCKRCNGHGLHPTASITLAAIMGANT